MSLAFNLGNVSLSCHREFQSRREIFPRHAFLRFPMNTTTTKSSLNVICSLTTATDWKRKIEEKLKGKDGNSPAAAAVEAADMPSNLCIIDTLQRLGVDRYFQSEINTILEDTYRLWKEKDTDIFSDVTIHAMAFRLLRVRGYEVSSEEIASYADQDYFNLQKIDVAMVIELYRAAQERIYEEEESTLEKLLSWTTTFLKHQLQTNSISNKKLHKLVEHYLKNYHGRLDRMEVRRSLDLYDINYYPPLKARFPHLGNEDFLSFARQDFNACQAQHQKELEQLQRWYSDCRFDTLNFGRNALHISNFLTSAIIGDPELSHVRLAFAKHIVLIGVIDDFFDHGGSREESHKILELVKDWKEMPAAEYGSEEVEILFTALYTTVNELAEMAHLEQGRSVKEFMVKLWVQIISVFKMEIDVWNEKTEQLTLDEYLSSTWISVGCTICILMSMQFLGVKLSDEMLLCEECTDLCRCASMVDRLLNDVQSFERERKENTGNCVSILLAARKGERGLTEEEAITKLKEMAEYNRRKLMQIVYKRGTIFPRICKDMFLKVCKIGCYLYWSSDEFTSPQKMKEDMKSLLYQPLAAHLLEADNKMSGGIDN